MGDTISKYYEISSKMNSKKIQDIVQDETNQIIVLFEEEYPELAEEFQNIQEILPQDKKKIYSIYKEFIPKNNKWNKYIKSKIKQPNKDLVDHIRDYFKCSSKEAKEYIYILDKPKINRILTNRGLNKKELKILLK